MHITVSGQKGFLERHHQLIKALEPYGAVGTLACGQISTSPLMDVVTRAVMNRVVKKASFRMSERFWKSPWAFERRSRVAEVLRRQQTPQPDLVLHLMGLFCPVWEDLSVPYVIYTDYTMELARQRWLDWIPFSTELDYQRWIACERRIYQNARHVFTMIGMAADSVVEHYGVPATRVSAIGAGGRRSEPWTGTRSYGSRTILFNGSRWLIKGGDRMLEAFPLVRQAIPDARLIMVGCNPTDVPEGVTVMGMVKDAAVMESLFQTADLLVAPARIEALGTICLEAMEYGTPCLVATGTGMLDYVRHDKTGWVQQDCAPEPLAQSIIRCLQNPDRLAACGAAGRELVVSRYNWTSVAREIMRTVGHPSALIPAAKAAPAAVARELSVA